MEFIGQNAPSTSAGSPTYRQAWQLALGTLKTQLPRVEYDTWVSCLKPVSYQNKVLTVEAFNPYGRDWAEQKLQPHLTRLLQGYLNEPVTLEFVLQPGTPEPTPAKEKMAAAPSPANFPEPLPKPAKKLPPRVETGEPSPRKLMLQRAYGTRRASIIQPERGMFITNYLSTHWLPILGSSAYLVVLAARSMCYWNPSTGEMRNQIETEMGDLAARACVSLRTVKDVLSDETIKRYFLRYKVRRMMTPNGVRTAGIWLSVRMDDPLTPDDQEHFDLEEDDVSWYPPEFDD
jgi:hypothetical protein